MAFMLGSRLYPVTFLRPLRWLLAQRKVTSSKAAKEMGPRQSWPPALSPSAVKRELFFDRLRVRSLSLSKGHGTLLAQLCNGENSKGIAVLVGEKIACCALPRDVM